MRDALKRALAAAVGGAVLCAGLSGASAGAERETPSGLPVPRYISLKFDKVDARAGPGSDHKILWVYRAKGLPLQVVAETFDWRRVCDPEGHVVWVHKRTTEGRRTVMNTTAKPMPLLVRPKEGAGAAGYLNPRALATLDDCQKGWCKVRVQGVTGWTPEGQLWGTSPAVQCH